MSNGRIHFEATLKKFELNETAFEFRNIFFEDFVEVGELDFLTIKGTSEFQGETSSELISQMKDCFEGKYGEFLPKASFVVLDQNKKIIGASVFVISKSNKIPLLTYVMTHDQHKKRGICSFLLKKSMNTLIGMGFKNSFLAVKSDNIGAIRLYKKLGYKLMSKTVKFYIFRHGQTDWNLELRSQGHTDIPLNETGREQAKELKPILENLKLDQIVSSDLSRAFETACIASEGLGFKILKFEDLRELNFGEPVGQVKDDIIKKYGLESWERCHSVKPEDMDFAYPGGESKIEHLKKIRGRLESFYNENQGERIGVATHGGALRRLVHTCVNAPSEPIDMSNCVIYCISFNGKDWIFEGSGK